MTTESKSKEQEEQEDYQDQLDFCKIFFGCSEFDSRGNLQAGKWSKLEKTEFPFSKKRVAYLLGKFVLGLDSKVNPRVDK